MKIAFFIAMFLIHSIGFFYLNDIRVRLRETEIDLEKIMNKYDIKM